MKKIIRKKEYKLITYRLYVKIGGMRNAKKEKKTLHY